MVTGKTKVDKEQTKELKKQSLDHELDEDTIEQIISSKEPVPKKKAIKLREDLFTKYFTEGETLEEIEDTIARALELLRSQTSS